MHTGILFTDIMYFGYIAYIFLIGQFSAWLEFEIDSLVLFVY